MNSFFEVNITKPIRLIELFSGIGAQAKALERLKADFEGYKTSDWDVSAVASYYKIHNGNDKIDYSKNLSVKELQDELLSMGISVNGKEPMSHTQIKRKGEKWLRSTYNHFKATHNLGSVTNIHGKDLEIVNKDKYCYIMSYSSPCQDLSVAGKQAGMKKDSGTRSGLLWEVERILNELKEIDALPDILLLENVPQIHGKKFMSDFQKWIDALSDIGYMSYWQDLNAKDFGVAQQRKRTFMVSILGHATYSFPEPIPLEKRMKDYLDDIVDEKYYINNERSEKLIQQLIVSGQLDDLKSGGAVSKKKQST